MKKYRRPFPFMSVLLFILLLPAACNSNLPSEFTRNQKLWEANHLTDYNFTLQRNCFCPEDRRGPVDIQVRKNATISIIFTESGVTANPDFFSDVDTIDELFGVLKNAHMDKAVQVDVTYDATYGYPQSIYIDVSKEIADEEQGYTVSNLQVIHIFGNPK